MSRLPACLLLVLGLAACAERYSPDTYATRAVQQANKVDQGVVVGVRKVQISAEGSTGTAAGAAAGGVLGAQTPGTAIVSALGGVGGALVGGLVGRAAESAAVDTPAHEYVVRTDREELLSVTQKDSVPLVVGQRVLVIAGTQARIVPDYTVVTGPATPPPPRGPAPAEPAASAPEPPVAAASGAEEALRRLLPNQPAPPVIVPAPPRPEAAVPSIAAEVAAAIARE